jgi:hypothetical protein
MNDAHPAALAILAFVGGFSWLGTREVRKLREYERAHPYSQLARRLNAAPGREWCDEQQGARRVYAAAVVDRFGAEIRALWKARAGQGEPKFSLVDLGTVKLRVSPKLPPATGFDRSAWSWDEAYGLIQRTQADPDAKENTDRWRDVDSMVRFLLEKDYSREIYHRKFDAPEVTEHRFRPNPGVARTGARELTVELDPGEFHGREEALRRIFEPEWSGAGWAVKVRWVRGGNAYRLRSHFDSNRSFVNHRYRTLEIANLAWTKTVAHELGHVLGFDDHYYNVWSARNCYYSQESRLSDIMSNSEHGAVTSRHWEILDSAYPWRGERKTDPFPYVYGK